MSITSAQVSQILSTRPFGSRLMLHTAFWIFSVSRQFLPEITIVVLVRMTHQTLAGLTIYHPHLTTSIPTSRHFLKPWDSRTNPGSWWAGEMVHTTPLCTRWRIQASLADWSLWTQVRTGSNGLTYSGQTTGQRSRCSNIGKQTLWVVSAWYN